MNNGHTETANIEVTKPQIANCDYHAIKIEKIIILYKQKISVTIRTNPPLNNYYFVGWFVGDYKITYEILLQINSLQCISGGG
jgi:hypothetical protein